MKNDNYFSKEKQDLINSMSNDEMNGLLLDLESTDYWIAILKYSQGRQIVVQNALITGDPIKNATEMCRNQGILMGQSDLAQMVIMLKERADKNGPEKVSKKE